MVKVYFTDDAREDLRDLKRYVLTHWGKAVWEKEIYRIKAAVNSVSLFPLNGTVPVLLSKLGMNESGSC
jgi:plasmid stabilization system protein ParE